MGPSANDLVAGHSTDRRLRAMGHRRTFVTLLILAGCWLCGCADTRISRQASSAAVQAAGMADTRAVAAIVDLADEDGPQPPAEKLALLQRAGSAHRGLLTRQLAAMAATGDVDLYADNEALLLKDGPQTFAAMFEAIAGARRVILLESYIIDDAEVAWALARMLIHKRSEGVQVGVIYDDFGSLTTPSGYFDALRLGGVLVCAFNPVNPVQRPGYWDIDHRDHRKILVVDDRIAFTGGINISGVYASGSIAFGRGRDYDREAGWRDTQLRIRGPAVEPLAALLRRTWLSQGCEGELPGFEAEAPSGGGAAGETPMWIVPSSPDDDYNRIYAMLLSAIEASRVSVRLTMAYFAPGREMVDALCDAARRGVSVRMILPSASDFEPVLYAGRGYYQTLLAAGVEIYEFEHAVLHAKTAIIDGVVSTVGSSNMDWRSFVGNDEVNVVVLGAPFAAGMQAMFAEDLAASKKITIAEWRARPLHQRVLEALARIFERWF